MGISEAVEVYGSVSYIKVGIRGGFKGVRYGSFLFTNRVMDPRGKVEIPQVVWDNGVIRMSSSEGSTLRLSEGGIYNG